MRGNYEIPAATLPIFYGAAELEDYSGNDFPQKNMKLILPSIFGCLVSHNHMLTFITQMLSIVFAISLSQLTQKVPNISSPAADLGFKTFKSGHTPTSYFFSHRCPPPSNSSNHLLHSSVQENKRVRSATVLSKET